MLRCKNLSVTVLDIFADDLKEGIWKAEPTVDLYRNRDALENCVRAECGCVSCTDWTIEKYFPDRRRRFTAMKKLQQCVVWSKALVGFLKTCKGVSKRVGDLRARNFLTFIPGKEHTTPAPRRVSREFAACGSTNFSDMGSHSVLQTQAVTKRVTKNVIKEVTKKGTDVLLVEMVEQKVTERKGLLKSGEMTIVSF